MKEFKAESFVDMCKIPQQAPLSQITLIAEAYFNLKIKSYVAFFFVFSFSRQLMCKGARGLLTKIVEVMKKEPTTSTFRYKIHVLIY